jgi:6-hydroxymethylpterin diphosphokinase MptE-like
VSFLAGNMRILERRFPEAAELLTRTGADPAVRIYPARDGSSVAHERFEGREYPLHSTVAPAREKERSLKNLGNAGFVVSYGLGSGWHLRGIVEEGRRELLLIVDGVKRLRSLVEGQDLRDIISYPRLRLLIDPAPGALEQTLLDSYLPALHGSLGFVPLTALAARRRGRYDLLRNETERALELIRRDFSVQAHFGLLWTRNILANLGRLQGGAGDIGALAAGRRRAAIVGAGPSLRTSLPELRSLPEDTLILSTDTALPTLLEGGVRPHAAVSIDSQFYTLLHREHPASGDIPWIVSLAAPAALVRNLGNPLFFSSGNPLEGYIAGRSGMPRLDTGGGNVLQTAFSAAEYLRIDEVLLYGADYANPLGVPYSPGSYIDRWFRVRSRRTRPVVSAFLGFVFDSRKEADAAAYNRLYPAPRLDEYRRRMEEYLRVHAFKISFRGPARLDRPIAPASVHAPPEHQEPAGGLPPRTDTGKILSSLLETVKSGNAEAVRLLYPLAAYLRLREGDPGPGGAEELLERAREHFLVIAESSLSLHGYSPGGE